MWSLASAFGLVMILAGTVRRYYENKILVNLFLRTSENVFQKYRRRVCGRSFRITKGQTTNSDFFLKIL